MPGLRHFGGLGHVQLRGQGTQRMTLHRPDQQAQPRHGRQQGHCGARRTVGCGASLRVGA
jgi:hypothetical protein